jgi:hypothetical protein
MKYQKIILVIVAVILAGVILYFGVTWLMAQLQGHVPRAH